jgi:UDP-3-O-[3-hydroxymyristoyl] N-acetylglucosamine deacetylase
VRRGALEIIDLQRTLSEEVCLSGTGLHSGARVGISILPAPADRGITFRRTDLPGAPAIPARWDAVVASRLCTVIANAAGDSVSTIEHLMAALAGTGIHNATVLIDGPEVPILDGSAAPFVAAILAAGITVLPAPVRVIRIRRSVTVEDGAALARLEPAEMPELDFRIDFADAAIGRQARQMVLANGAFVRELADSRTFCRQADVTAMQAQGLALGGTYHNAVVVEGDRILSPGGLRHADEPVRHKMLDAVGDLALAGGPILGRYTGIRAGHALTNRLLRTLFADPSAFERADCALPMHRKLPGVGVSAADLRVGA